MRTACNGAVVHTPQGWRLRGPHSAAANRFLERIALRGLAAGSRRTYAFDLLVILRWLDRRRLRAERLREEDLYVFVRDHQGHLKAVTLNRVLRLLHRLHRFMHPAEQRARPAPRLRRRLRLPYVKEPRTIKRPLLDTQVQRVVTDLRTNRDRAILGLMWALGLRIGEVLALRWEDLDWEHATVQVRGKGNRERNVPLPQPVAVLLRRYRSVEWPRAAGPTVFVVLKGPRRGQALTYAAARRIFRYHRERLNLPAAHPHRFRHTFAANMIRQGMSVPSLMRLLGHTWAQTTLRYVHFDDAEVREHYAQALQKLAQTAAVSAADVCAVL